MPDATLAFDVESLGVMHISLQVPHVQCIITTDAASFCITALHLLVGLGF